jgi:hypothetical protein
MSAAKVMSEQKPRAAQQPLTESQLKKFWIASMLRWKHLRIHAVTHRNHRRPRTSESDGDGRVVYMVLYHSVHGERYRNWDGRDLWVEALEYLGRSIRRVHGLIWLDRARMVPDLPSPYKPIPKFTPRKRRPKTKWYKDIAARAEQNQLSVSEQIAVDRNTRRLG